MRTISIALLISIAAAAGAGAQTTSARKAGLRPAPPAAESPSLRGPVSPDQSQDQSQGQPSKPPPPPSAALMSTLSPLPAAATTRSDPLQCRQTCAHSYYFCLAGQDADVCPQTWGECVATCDDTLAPADQPAGLLPAPKE